MKYELTTDSKSEFGRKLFRIRALISFGDVKAGDLGGFVESEKNLSQKGNAWVYDNAVVYENAFVGDDATVHDYAEVNGYAKVRGNAQVRGNAHVYEHALVYGNAHICDNSVIRGYAHVRDNAVVNKCGSVYGNAVVYKNAIISGVADVCAEMSIQENAILNEKEDCISVKGFGEYYSNVTFYKSTDGIRVSCGFFRGPLKDLKDSLKNRTIKDLKEGGGAKETKWVTELELIIQFAEVRFEN